MDIIKKQLIEKLNDFKTRELSLDIFVLYIDTLGEKLAVFIKFRNEILRPYGLRMTGKG
jgi:hypothetical protein